MNKFVLTAFNISGLCGARAFGQVNGSTPPPAKQVKSMQQPRMSCATTSQAQPFSVAPAPLAAPPNNSCIRYLNINVHFMQKDDGSGNFGQYDDGLGSTLTNGYMFADTLIDMVNTLSAMNYNPPLWFYPSDMPQPNNLPLNMQFVLKGVYYHRSSLHYNYVHGWGNNEAVENNTYSINNDKEINLFILNPTNQAGNYVSLAGQASSYLGGVNNARISIGGAWQVDYRNCISWGFERVGALYWAAYPHSSTVLHELGHLLSLRHSFELNDGCDDTRPGNLCWNFDEPFSSSTPISACDETHEISNNLMDYTAHQNALSPCQIGRMNNVLAGSMAPFINSCVSPTQFNPCPPVSAFFDFPSISNICNGSVSTSPIVWGSGSYGETGYTITINRTNALNSNVIVNGTLQTFSFTGQIGKIDLRSIYNFLPNYYYRIGLRVNTMCRQSELFYRWTETREGPDCYFQPGPPVNNKITIFPNPSHSGGSISLSSPDGMFLANEKLSVSIWQPQQTSRQNLDLVTDESGILSTTIRLNKYTPGLYFITLRSTSGQNITQKIIVQ